MAKRREASAIEERTRRVAASHVQRVFRGHLVRKVCQSFLALPLTWRVLQWVHAEEGWELVKEIRGSRGEGTGLEEVAGSRTDVEATAGRKQEQSGKKQEEALELLLHDLGL